MFEKTVINRFLSFSNKFLVRSFEVIQYLDTESFIQKYSCLDDQCCFLRFDGVDQGRKDKKTNCFKYINIMIFIKDRELQF